MSVAFSALLAKLNQAKTKEKDPALYETIKGILTTADTNQAATNTQITNNVSGLEAGVVTYDNALAFLPNSRKLNAGSGITLDLSIGGIITVNSSASGTDFAFFIS